MKKKAASLDLGELAVADRLEVGLSNAGKLDDVLIPHDDRVATIDHRTHCQLRQ